MGKLLGCGAGLLISACTALRCWLIFLASTFQAYTAQGRVLVYQPDRLLPTRPFAS